MLRDPAPVEAEQDLVAAWLRDDLGLPQYAAAAERHTVDGDVLLDLNARDRLAALGVEDDLHQRSVEKQARNCAT